MTSKFSPHHQNNILQPKRLNSAETICKPTKGAHNRLPAGMITGPTLTLNGVTIGLPPSVQAIPSIAGTTSAKKASNTMAKRNARERNRVKQVNMGFQTLRHHIPENYRMKKMSKVDTLRCAVDYIRSMEQILEITPIPASPLTDAMLMTTDSPYHSFSSPDMNQHLDKICSEGSSISLEQSYSSFSENDDENPQHNCSHNSRSLTSSSLHEQHALHHQFTDHQLDQEQCAPSVAIVTSSANSIPLQALVATSEGSSTPIILPLQLHSQQQLEKNGDILRSADENFNPPSSSFIRVLEIVQLQS